MLHANQDILGIAILINVHAVKHQDQLSMEYVHVHHQKLNGMLIVNNVFVHQTLLVTIVNLAHLQEYGIGMQTSVYAHHQQTTGILLQENVNAQLEDMDQIVLNVHHQDIGISILINAFVKAL